MQDLKDTRDRHNGKKCLILGGWGVLDIIDSRVDFETEKPLSWDLKPPKLVVVHWVNNC